MSNEKPGMFATAIAVILLSYLGCKACISTNEDSDSIKPVTTNQPAQSPKALTKADTLRIRKDFADIRTMLDNIHKPTVKASNQFNRFCSLYDAGRVSIYEVYETAKVAKNHYDRAEDEVNELHAPDILPDSDANALSSSLSQIATFYMVKEEAFDKIMDAIDGNGRFKKLDAASNDVKEALRDYNKSIAEIYLLGSKYGASTKQHKWEK